jgi:F-type H+-transporting ATPase subunit b
MDQILNQLGGLILGSIPTIIFFVLLVVAYGFLVRRPLDRVLAERRARTSGAIEQARGAISAAEAETAVFEDKLGAAKREIYEARDAKLKQWAAEREQALERAKAATATKVSAAKQALEQSAVAAKQQIEGLSGELSAQILKAVLPKGVSGSEAAQ